MKILKIEHESLRHDNKEDDMDLLDVLVEYLPGVIVKCSMYRAHYKRLLCQEIIMKKYHVPESDLNDFVDLLRDEFNADHFYDEDGES